MSAVDHAAMVAFLEQAVATVLDLETRANQAVNGEDGQSAYTALMREKATFLASLADEAEPFADAYPQVMSRLERFSASAATSLSVGSVFFMSALLYPEDHQPGQSNDLETLLKEVKGLND